MTFEPGTEFGKYTLLAKVGAGGMAEIYKARWAGPDGFEKILVIKKILPAYAQNRAFIKMLIAEAKVSSALQHANIVQIYELGEIDGQYYIAMEYVQGADLLRVLTDCTRTGAKPGAGLALYIVSEICKGLAHAHEATDTKGRPLNIIHRDVSPSNILLSYDGAVKVMDFGVARADLERANNDRRRNTASGVLKGKLGYMSPEQVIGAEIDRRSDIFALGILLFEALTLKRLFLGKTDLETLINIRDVKIGKKLRRHNYISAGIQEMLRKALAKDPTDRYQTATDFQEAILDYLFENRIRISSRKLQDFLVELQGADNASRPLDPPQAPQTPPSLASPPTDRRGRGNRTRSSSRTAGDGLAPLEATTAPTPAEETAQPLATALPPSPSTPGPVAASGRPDAPDRGLESPPTKGKRGRHRTSAVAPTPAERTRAAIEEDALLIEAERLAETMDARATARRTARAEAAAPAVGAVDPGVGADASVPIGPLEEVAAGADEPGASRPPVQLGVVGPATKPLPPEASRPTATPAESPADPIPTLEPQITPPGERRDGASGDRGQRVDSSRLASASFKLRNLAGDVFGPITFTNFVDLLRSHSVSATELISVDDGEWSRLEDLTVIRDLEPGLFAPEAEPALYEGPVSRLMTPRLLYRLAVNRVAGKLQFTQGMMLKEVFFQNGVPVHITSNLKSELLGAFMLERDLVKLADLDRAVATVKDTGGRLGDALVRLGMLKPHDLFRILELQFRTRFLEIFRWERGWYQFFEGHVPPEDIVWMGNDTVQLLTVGVRTQYDLPTMRRTFEDHADQIIAIEHNPHITHNNLRLNSRELRFYTYLESGQALRSTLSQYGRTDEECLTLLQVIFVLHQTDLLTFRHPQGASAA